MKLDHHEEVFRKTLQQQHVPLDTKKLWGQIEPHIDSVSEDRKPAFFWWIFGGLSSVVLIVAAVFLINKNYTISIDEKNNTQATAEIFATNIKQEKTATKNETNPVVNTTSAIKNNVNKKEKKEYTSTPKIARTDASSSTIINQSSASNKNTLKPRLNQESSQTKTVSSERQVSLSEAAEEEEEEATNSSTESDNAKHATKSSIIPTYIAPIETIKNEAPKVRSKQAVAALDNNADAIRLTSTIEPISNLKPISELMIPFDELSFHPLTITKNKKNKWSVFAEAGMGVYTSNSFTNAKNDVAINEPMSEQINDLSTTQRYQNATVGVSFNLNKSFSIQTGLSYTRFLDQVRLNNVVELGSTSNGREEILYVNDTSSVDQTNVYVAFETIRRIESPIKKSLYHHYVDVPIKMAYNRRIGRLTIGGSLGVLLNLNTSTSGVYLNQNNELISANLDSNNAQFRGEEQNNRLKINYMAGLHLGYQLSPALEIYASPSARLVRDFNNIQSESQNNILATGLNLGVQMRIR